MSRHPCCPVCPGPITDWNHVCWPHRQPLESGEHWTVRVEDATGSDSIPTIERVYERSPSGAFVCPFPRCSVRRKYAVAMWNHVHFIANPDHRRAEARP